MIPTSDFMKFMADSPILVLPPVDGRRLFFAHATETEHESSQHRICDGNEQLRRYRLGGKIINVNNTDKYFIY